MRRTLQSPLPSFLQHVIVLSQCLTDLYLPHGLCRLLSQRVSVSLSPSCPGAPAADVGQPRQLFSTSQHCSPGGGANPAPPGDELNRTLSHSLPPLLLCCFWPRQSNRFPVDLTMAGGKEDGEHFSRLGPPRKTSLRPFTPAAGEVESSLVVLGNGLLLVRGGCGEGAAAGKLFAAQS